MMSGITRLLLNDESSLDASLFDPEHKLYLHFELEGDYYGIPIENVAEVRSWADIKVRPLVKAPDFLLGVFNLRGNIVPVVDLRRKWQCLSQDFESRTAVIVLTIERRMWAIVVDAIKEVAGLRKEQILPAPTLNSKLNVQYFHGIAERQAGHTVMLLDIEKVMTSSEMGLMDSFSS